MIISVNGPSGGKLASLLGCSVYHPNGEDRDYPEYGSDRIRDRKMPVYINYGCKRKSLPVDCINYESEDVADKVWCFKMFETCDIPHPELIDPSTFKGSFLGRDNGKSKGRGITFYNEGNSPRQHDFFVKFIKGKSEHRVHVWGSEVLIELNKQFGTHSFIQSSPYGAKMRAGHIAHKKRIEIIDKAVEAVNILGLHYGAVDILVDENDNYYILEVNSAPSLAGIFAYVYAEYINRKFDLGIAFDQALNGNKLIDTSWEKYSEKYLAK
jgi:hypothetical protein